MTCEACETAEARYALDVGGTVPWRVCAGCLFWMMDPEAA